MKRRRLVRALAALLGGAVIAPGLLAKSKPYVEVWKDPNCGCCKDWVVHLEANGFKVKVLDTGNTEARKRLGIPEALVWTLRLELYYPPSQGLSENELMVHQPDAEV